MTLATRIIGTLLVDGGTGILLHRVHFKTERVRGNPRTQANVYASRSMDEILLLDVTATEQKREPDYELISDIVGETFLPVSYGGGITSVEQAVRIVAECGADKVVFGTRFDLIDQIGQRLGRQAVVTSLDDGRWGSSVMFAKACEESGAGEILLQSIDRDGTLSGYDLGLIESISNVVSIPVIASSGCGKPADMVAAMKAGASAVSAGWMWNATDTRPADCKRALNLCECGHDDHASLVSWERRPRQRPYEQADHSEMSACMSVMCEQPHLFTGWPVRITSQEAHKVG